MKTFGYARVSTTRQAEDGESLATQERQVSAWCALQNWPAPAMYVERGVSGSVPFAERPEGARLLAAIRPGDVLVIAKLDRAFRDAADALETLKHFKNQGISLVFIDLGGDVTGNGIAKLVFTILSAVAEQERDRTRERIRDVKGAQKALGRYLGGRVPFGYSVIDKGTPDAPDKWLVPDAGQQETLAEMVALRAQGTSLNELGRLFGFTPMSVKRILDRQSA